jgi:hypothetical protein
MMATSNHWSERSNSERSWPPHYHSEYVTTPPWYDIFWHPYGRITRQKFNKIRVGMTRQQVTDIIDGPGRVISESMCLNLHSVTVVYKGRFWSQKSATFTFRNGILRTKSRY